MEATTSTADATRFTPDALLAWLRRQRAAGSIHHDEQQRIWQVFGYADTERVLSDPSAFSSNFSEIIPHQRDFDLLAQGNFVRMDPPKHRKLRALVSQAFTPRMVTALTPRIAELRDEVVVLRGTATVQCGLPSWRVLAKIASNYHLRPRAPLSELRQAAQWPLRLLYSPRTRAVEPRTSGSARRARISSRVRRSSVPVAIPVLVLPPPAVAAAVVTAGPPPGGCRSARRGATVVPSEFLTSRCWSASAARRRGRPPAPARAPTRRRANGFVTPTGALEAVPRGSHGLPIVAPPVETRGGPARRHPCARPWPAGSSVAHGAADTLRRRDGAPATTSARSPHQLRMPRGSTHRFASPPVRPAG